MNKHPKLAPSQWKTLTSAFSNISQAIILFSLAAFFVPQTVNLPEDFSKEFAIWVLIYGLVLLTLAVLISKRGK